MPITLIIIAAVSVVLYIVSTIMIYDYLMKAGEKGSFLWLRFSMIPNVGKYKKLTLEKTGKTGPLYYIWIASINLALICVIILFSKFRNF